MIVGALGFFMVLRSVPGAGYFTLAYIVCVGVTDRLLFGFMHTANTGADVLDATREAIQVVLSGRNPYLHAFMTTRPAHAPFPYLPGEIFFYGVPYLFHVSVGMTEWCAGIGILFLIAASAPIVGAARASICTALYALCSGSNVTLTNDVGLAFTAICAILLLAWSETLSERGASRRAISICFYASAVFFAWALLFKALFWPVFPFIAVYLWRRDQRTAKNYLSIILGICQLTVLPFLFSGAGGFLFNVFEGFVYHHRVFWGINLWNGMHTAGVGIRPGGIVPMITDFIVVGGVCLLLLRRPSLSLGAAVMRGSGCLATVLLLSRYTPFVYWTFASIILIGALALLPQTTASVPQSAETVQ